MTQSKILILLILAAFISPYAVASFVAYPVEYNEMKIVADNLSIASQEGNAQVSIAYSTGAVFSELRRQSILMEKQNELLSDRNDLQATQNKIEYEKLCTVVGYGNIHSRFCEGNSQIAIDGGI